MLNFRQHIHYLIVLLLLFYTRSSNAQTHKSQEYIAQLANAANGRDSVNLLYRAAVWSLREGDAALSEQYARKGLAISTRINDKVRQARGYFYISDCYLNKDDSDSSTWYARRSIAMYDSAGKKGIYYPYALNNIAAHYLDKGDAAQALKYGHLQMDAAVEMKDTLSISNSYTMLCAVYELLNNTEQCIRYAEKALAINRLMGANINMAVVLTNLATLYIQHNKVDKALPLLYEALELTNNNDAAPRDYGLACMLLGECHTQLQQYDSSLYYLQKSEAALQRIDNPEFKIKLWNIYSNTYRAQRKYTEALEYIEKCIAIAGAKGMSKPYAEALEEKSKILAEMHDYKEAYSYYKLYSTVNDSIANAEVQKTIAGLREKYESDKKDKEIAQQQQLNALLTNEALLKDQQLHDEILLKEALAQKNELVQERLYQDSVLTAALSRENLLKKEQLAQAGILNTTLAEENTLRAADLDKQRVINALLIGGFALVLLLSGLIFIQYSRQRTANKTISEQSNKLTLLMKELHHRVKNNLQIISSLLSLQSFRIKDEAASRAVKEGQQRIEAMSLIHQRLYTRDNITEINIREFISDLVDSLQDAYGFKKDSISIRLDIDNELMNVDQAIPLSLIVNELVTNAFKYAYEDNNHPELTIKLNKDEDGLHLAVADNGKGVNIEEWKDKEGSFGKELIQTFVQQLNGYLAIAVDKGTEFKLSIPNAA